MFLLPCYHFRLTSSSIPHCGATILKLSSSIAEKSCSSVLRQAKRVASFSEICTMKPTTVFSGVPPQLQALQPIQSAVNSFWHAEHLHELFRNLQETVDLVKAVQKELEEILLIRQNDAEAIDFHSDHSSEKNFSPSSNDSNLPDVFQCFGCDMPLQISETLREKRISLNVQEYLSLEAANSLISSLKYQLVPFSAITSQTSSWEQRSMAVRLAQKLQKAKRNKCWKKRKRKQVAELPCKEHECYDKADQDADEWRAREIAKDIARRKVESMKAIAKLKANEERKRLESEFELALVVEKLQEARSIRIQKLKKQGHFLPEEDDKFLEGVRAAVEEEECQAAAAADTDAAKDAIATAEVSRKTIHSTSTGAHDVNHKKGEAAVNREQFNGMESEISVGPNANREPEPQKSEGQGCGRGYDSTANLHLSSITIIMEAIMIWER